MDALYYQVDLLKTLNDKLSESSRINEKFLSMSGNVYYYYNFRDDHFEASGDFLTLFGLEVKFYTDTELLSEFVRGSDIQCAKEVINSEDSGAAEITNDFCLRDNKKWIEASAFTEYDEDHNPLEKYVCFKDITKFKMQNDELTYMAYYDSLTGLSNRNCFVKELRDMVERAKSEKTTVSVAMMDIDSFKRINDSIGLVLGDELVQDVGQYLMEFKNDKTIVGRFGTDVFVMAIFDPCGSDTIQNVYKSIRLRLKRPFVLSNGDEIFVSMTTGVASYPDAGDTGFIVLQNAEVCVYEAKDKCRSGIRYFDSELLNRFLQNFSMEQRLHDAIEMKSFMLYFQPQFSTKTGKLRGCEALIRWQDTEGNFISPAEFIPLAERSGGIIAIGNWVLNEAMMTYLHWRNQLGFSGIISINISAIQMKKENFVSNVLGIIRRLNIDPGDIELEITESVFIDDFDEMIEKISALREYGIRISLDDFGMGYSSLSYLKNLPIDTLKIDKSFIDTAITDNSTGIITESVVNMVKKLGLETIAEGVENEDQMEFLKRISCDNIQGFLLGKPMPSEQFEALIAEDTGR